MPDSQFPSEEAVEAAARAEYAHAMAKAPDKAGVWEGAGDDVRLWYRDLARRILTAAAPFVSPERSGGGDLLGAREAAEELGVHENTIRNWQRSGAIKAVTLPGSGFRRFSRAEVNRMRSEMWSQFAPDTTIEEACRDNTERGDS